MTKAEVYEAISAAFYSLAHTNTARYDFWISELYDQDGDFVHTMWSESTLKLMDTDVMMQLN
jgi:hypothetical protein